MSCNHLDGLEEIKKWADTNNPWCLTHAEHVKNVRYLLGRLDNRDQAIAIKTSAIEHMAAAHAEWAKSYKARIEELKAEIAELKAERYFARNKATGKTIKISKEEMEILLKAGASLEDEQT